MPAPDRLFPRRGPRHFGNRKVHLGSRLPSLGIMVLHFVYERGGTMILHLGPLDWPSFLSSVTSGQSSASANATYQAS